MRLIVSQIKPFMSFENKNTLGLEKTRFCQFDEFENVHEITQEILVRRSSYNQTRSVVFSHTGLYSIICYLKIFYF